jgi:mRNA interferase YafQ
MLTLSRTTTFKRDYKREAKNPSHTDLGGLLQGVLALLLSEQPLPEANRDHALRGDWKGYRDCHLKPDLVLIYKKAEGEIQLVRVGSHSELFG